ncbi:NAD(P)H-dependent FMN reductase [Nocardioides zeae]|uniref:NAD(P)H-dependent FMN reductase n=1 Tax=Nocardioides zeae TaxID=1457234 RepID=A0ACC6IIU7_9ACTN|nr:NAD(P)H-dependent oxidoreductase [Nocardioides zeae]MDR6174642.1 NAD(P)H-dependent FMN reductase [Nocardioides zeae]MDR6210711.1 NAD(P)H-dependent FMN reductase [Nocardioides zeae]
MPITDPQPARSAASGPGAPLLLTVISASVRDDRVGRTIADWVATRTRAGHADVSLVDLAEIQLPDDRLLRPGGGGRTSIADQIDASDGFVVVTPEYNHSYPAPLKRAIDWHYGEWMFKAATVVSYGAHGGRIATEHLRGVFAELHVATTRSTVGLTAPWNDVGPAGYDAPEGVDVAMDRALAELTWWASALRQARTERPLPR